MQTNLTVAAVGIKPPGVFWWISRCWSGNSTIQQLEDTRGYELLDQHLSIGMLNMIELAKGKGRVLLADLHSRRSRCLASGTLLAGRVVVELFLDSFRTTDDTPYFTDYRHLEHFEFNFTQPDIFMSKWCDLVSKVDRQSIPDKMLLRIFFESI